MDAAARIGSLIAKGLREGPQAIAASHDISATPGRDPDHRATYAADPWAWARDIAHVRLSRQQEQVLEDTQTHDWCLFPAGTNVGKSFILAIAGLHAFDAVGSVRNAEGIEQGCYIRLMGPQHSSILATAYGQMLGIHERCARFGTPLPGHPSQKSVLWRVRHDWYIEAISPPKSNVQSVAHGASGRHYAVMVAIIEEAIGVPEAVLSATEGGFTGQHDKIFGAYNPTEWTGSLDKRCKSGAYHVRRLSSLDHPNVRERTAVIPKAVSVDAIERRIRSDECTDRGPLGQVQPDSEHHDFVYALPPPDIDGTPREDDYPGAQEGELRVYRPGGLFAGQVLGLTPAASSRQLFRGEDIDACVELWRSRQIPAEPPDRVGLDIAGHGPDDTVAVPAWGPDAPELMRLVRAVRASAEGATARKRIAGRIHDMEIETPPLGPHPPKYWEEIARRQRLGETLEEMTTEELHSRHEGALEGLRRTRSVMLGEPEVIPPGDGYDMARDLATRYSPAAWIADAGGPGGAVIEPLSRIHDHEVIEVAFGGAELERLSGEMACINRRAQMYLRMSELVRQHLIALPPSQRLREELMAHEWIPLEKSVLVDDGSRKELLPVMGVTSKDDLKRTLGRSPDFSDAAVLAVHPAEHPGWAEVVDW